MRLGELGLGLGHVPVGQDAAVVRAAQEAQKGRQEGDCGGEGQRAHLGASTAFWTTLPAA